MSSTLRNATEHTVHALTDLVGDAMQHVELPHIDLARVTRRRRSLSPALVVAFVVVIGAASLVTVIAVRARRGRASARGKGDAVTAPSEERMTAVAAA
jgi:hypothetical protein